MRIRFFSVIAGIGVMLASTCQLQGQQLNSASQNRPANHFWVSSTPPQPGDKLRSDMLKLVADSKAGRIAPHSQQFPATKVHNLSKTAKIAIIAGVAVVVLTIVVVHSLNDLHCHSRCVL